MDKIMQCVYHPTANQVQLAVQTALKNTAGEKVGEDDRSDINHARGRPSNTTAPIRYRAPEAAGVPAGE